MTSWSEDVTLGGRVTVRDVLFDAEHRLNAVRIPSPNVDAAELVAFALGTSRNRLFLQDAVTPDQKVRVEQLLARRLSRVPLQHILGTAAFRHIEVAVGPGVFIPRPETELVTEAGVRELALQPEGATEVLERPLAVEMAGVHTRGATVVDWNRQTGSPDNATILMRYDQARFEAMIQQALAAR